MKKKNKILMCLALTIGLSGCNKNQEINEEIYQEYIQLLDSVIPVYKEEDLFLTDQELDTIITSLYTEQEECKNPTFLTNDELTKKIIENSNEFLKTNHKCKEFLNDSNIRVLKNILTKLEKNATNDQKEDNHKLQNLKIVEVNNKTLPTGEYYPDQETIIINMDQLKNELKEIRKYNLNIELDDYVELVLAHEINHVRQFKCDCKKEQDHGSINVLDTMYTLTEASAESYLYNELGYSNEGVNENTFTYASERKVEILLQILTIFKKDVTMEDYYNAIYDSSLSDLYNYFSLDNNEEIKEFYKIIYGIESEKVRNYFFSKYKKKYNISEEEITQIGFDKIIGQAHYSDIFRIFLKNLINYTKDNELSLENNVELYQMIKGTVLRAAYNEIEPVKYVECFLGYSDEMVEDITSYDEIYKDYLQVKYGISSKKAQKLLDKHEEEISDLLNIYYEYSDTYKNLEEQLPSLKILKQNTYTPGYGLTAFTKYKEALKKEGKLEQIEEKVKEKQLTLTNN